MMTSKGLLAAVGLLAVLGGLVWWANQHPVKTDPATPPAPKILALNAADITGFRIVKAAQPPIGIKKLGDKWQITEPTVMGADQDVANTLVNAAAALNAERMIDEKPADLKEYGLVSPPLALEVTMKDGKVHKLLFGSDNPSNTGTYVKLDSDPKLYTITSYTKTSFDKSLPDIRDRRVMTFDKDKVTALALTAKGPAAEFAKSNGEWQITKPRPLRADSLVVDDLVRKLTEIRMDLTGDQKDVASGFASAAKVALVSVTGGADTQTLEVRKGKENTFLAKSSVLEGIYKVPAEGADALNKAVDDFRNKKLFDFAFNDPSKIEIGGKAYEKSGETWNSGPAKFDGGSVQAVIDKLRDLNAAKFSEKAGGTAALALAVTYGDKKKVEKVTIDKSGEEYLARRENDTSIYVIDKGAFDELQKAISGIKPAVAAPPAATKK